MGTAAVLRRPSAVWAGITLLALSGVALFSIWIPSGAQEAAICMFRHMGGTCPGCGMTRAIALLARGELAAAFAMHPLAPLLAAEAVLLWAVSGLQIARGRWTRPSWRAINVAIVLHAVLLYGVWIARS
jgi:hypothetical protein